jgi:hypothetical protein
MQIAPANLFDARIALRSRDIAETPGQVAIAPIASMGAKQRAKSAELKPARVEFSG